MSVVQRHPSSFRDPSGFIFESQGSIFRQVNKIYSHHYDLLISSGLYDELVRDKLIVAHKEVPAPIADPNDWYRTLQPGKIAVVSYPYEWCFEQVKQAALLTLDIALRSIEKGMLLKDATPYNIQFEGSRAILIDTLSFEALNENEPWVAYHQFCAQFLFPLYISSYTGTPVHHLYKAWPQGISAQVCWKLLPFSAKCSAGVWMNVYLQKSIRTSNTDPKRSSFSKQKLIHLLQHLRSEIARLTRKATKSSWSNYYSETIIAGTYVTDKEAAMRQCMDQVDGQVVLDLGCNDGHFSNLLALRANYVVAADDDPEPVSMFFEKLQPGGATNILPLVIDAADPSPAQGFSLTERSAFFDRVKPGVVVALALIHHLAIGRNVPMVMLASWFSQLSPRLIIEWIPKEDEKVQQLLLHRTDVFRDYTTALFEQHFSMHFNISKKISIGASGRVLYLMEKR